jgi:hypothetical protein
MVTSQITIETESAIQLLLQEREGGETEVETPAGLVDLLTDEYVTEIKHVKAWKEGTKVLVYQHYFPDRKPRIHLFGGYNQRFREMVEEILNTLAVTVTWERDPY